MSLPSIKTLLHISRLTPDKAREVRKVLEVTTPSELNELLSSGKYPATMKQYSSWLGIRTTKLMICDEIIGTHGVEYIPAGHNAKSPAIEYCNSGDPYHTTLMYVSGRGYKVGCWGDIVERGNYD